MLFVCRLLFIYDQRFIYAETEQENKIREKFCQLFESKLQQATITKTLHSTCQMPITRTSVDRIIMDARSSYPKIILNRVCLRIVTFAHV